MKKKVIGILIIGIIISSGFVAAEKNSLKPDENIDFENKITDTYANIVSYQNETEVKTTGPIAPLLNIAEVTIFKGPYIKTMIIRLILSSLRAYFLLPNISFSVNDLTFVVNYGKNVPNMMIFNQFSFNTTVIENGNEDIYNKRHFLVISGFDGTFGFCRAKFSSLSPARFRFEGTCDDVLVAS